MNIEHTQKKLSELKIELKALLLSVDRFMIEELSQVMTLLINRRPFYDWE